MVGAQEEAFEQPKPHLLPGSCRFRAEASKRGPGREFASPEKKGMAGIRVSDARNGESPTFRKREGAGEAEAKAEAEGKGEGKGEGEGNSFKLLIWQTERSCGSWF
jgi:hypothetical protein